MHHLFHSRLEIAQPSHLGLGLLLPLLFYLPQRLHLLDQLAKPLVHVKRALLDVLLDHSLLLVQSTKLISHPPLFSLDILEGYSEPMALFGLVLIRQIHCQPQILQFFFEIAQLDPLFGSLLKHRGVAPLVQPGCDHSRPVLLRHVQTLAHLLQDEREDLGVVLELLLLLLSLESDIVGLEPVLLFFGLKLTHQLGSVLHQLPLEHFYLLIQGPALQGQLYVRSIQLGDLCALLRALGLQSQEA